MYLFLLFFIFISYIVNICGQTTNSTSTINFPNSTYINPLAAEMPNEISITIPEILAINNPNLNRVKYLIGFLPQTEQKVLLAAYLGNNDSTRLFNNSIYNQQMFGQGLDQNIYERINMKFSQILTANSKKFKKGIGCLLKIPNQYAPSEQDINLLSINKNIESLVNSLIQYNNCQARFALDFSNINKLRRRFFLSTITSQMNAGLFNDDLSKDYFVGFFYSKSEQTKILTSFKNYALCSFAFHKQTSSLTIEIEQLTSQLAVCKGVNNTSSGKIIRSDGRTSNNYLINNGYGLGNGSFQYNIDNFPVTLLNNTSESPWIYDKINTYIQNNNLQSTVWNILASKIKLNLNNYNGFRISSHLHRTIFNYFVNNTDIINIKNEFYKSERCDACSSSATTNHIVYCDMLTCQCVGSPCNFTNFPNAGFQNASRDKSTYTSENSTKFNYGNSYFNIFISTFCFEGNRYIYSEGMDNIQGKQIDLISCQNSTSNATLSINTTKTVQACIAQFSSGQKNIKDLCRGSLTNLCGNQLDSMCGDETGFYEYLITNPPLQKPYPTECDESVLIYSDNNCFKWITQTFGLGSFGLRISGFFSLNLAIQNSIFNSKSTYTSTNEPYKVFPGNDPTANDPNVLALVESFLTSTYDSQINVDGAYDYIFPQYSTYYTDVKNSYTGLTLNDGNYDI